MDVIWSLLGKQKTYDILGTKDTGFIGAIGEAIAWQYLWDQGIHAIGLGASRSAFTPLTPEWIGSLEGHLTQEQIEFIFPPIDQELFESYKIKWGLPEEEMQRFSREVLSWDFVGWQRDAGKARRKACLVEVKTSRPGARPDQFRSQGRKGMAPEDLRKATCLGFVMLLVTVELTDTWEAIVCDQEIQADC